MPPNVVADKTERPTLQDAAGNPGTIKINVQGAFIVGEGTSADVLGDEANGYEYQHDHDIRLPNHTTVVSHIAVDVCLLLSRFIHDPVVNGRYCDRLVALLQSSFISLTNAGRADWVAV